MQQLIQSLIQLAILVLILISLWKIFVKAGQPGWAGIIPIYNLVILVLNIIKKPAIWILIGLIPIVNILVFMELAKKFGKPGWHGVLIFLFSFIYLPYLAFSDAKYTA